jgi:hypothetical protein
MVLHFKEFEGSSRQVALQVRKRVRREGGWSSWKLGINNPSRPKCIHKP